MPTVTDFLSPLPIDYTRALVRIEDAATRAARVIRSIRNPDAPTRGLDWTLAETAAHLCTTLRLYIDCLEQRIVPEPQLVPDVPTYVERMNQERLDTFTERKPQTLAQQLLDEVGQLLGILETRSPSETVAFPAGYRIDSATQACFTLAELLIHGRDIARSIHQPWPISRDDAILVLSGVIAILPLGVDRSRIPRTHATIHVRLRDNGCYAMDLHQKEVRAIPCHGRADLYVSLDPVAALLSGYGRVPPILPALTGKAFAWGRKPWLALALPRMFRTG